VEHRSVDHADGTEFDTCALLCLCCSWNLVPTNGCSSKTKKSHLSTLAKTNQIETHFFASFKIGVLVLEKNTYFEIFVEFFLFFIFQKPDRDPNGNKIRPAQASFIYLSYEFIYPINGNNIYPMNLFIL
jgi:hypothetical protein